MSKGPQLHSLGQFDICKHVPLDLNIKFAPSWHELWYKDVYIGQILESESMNVESIRCLVQQWIDGKWTLLRKLDASVPESAFLCDTLERAIQTLSETSDPFNGPQPWQVGDFFIQIAPPGEHGTVYVMFPKIKEEFPETIIDPCIGSFEADSHCLTRDEFKNWASDYINKSRDGRPSKLQSELPVSIEEVQKALESL